MLKAITDQLYELGREYDVINLYSEGFNPVMDSPGLSLYSRGETYDENVRKYQSALSRTDHLIYLFPIWWGMMPAMLKGFIDKVFLKGEVFDYTPEGALIPCLNISNTTLITTSEVDTEVISPFIEGYFTPLVLNSVGMNNVTWFNCDKIKSGSDIHRKEFMNTVVKHIAQ